MEPEGSLLSSKCPSLDLILNNMNLSTPSHLTAFICTLILSFHLSLDHPCSPALRIIAPKQGTHFSSLPIRTTYTAHFTFLDWIVLIIFDGQHKSLNSSLCSVLLRIRKCVLIARTNYKMQTPHIT